jgi:thiol-disulfide isomerase/thioredoxin
MAEQKQCGLGAVGIIVLVLLILGAVLYIARMSGRSGGLDLEWPPEPTGTKMDYDWTVQDLEGRPFELAKTRGKVVFLNFWATWCPPCVAEMPSIQRLYEELQGSNVAFAAVSSEDADAVRRFVKENDYTFPVYVAADSIPGDLRPRAIPTTYIVRRDGAVVVKHVGSAQWDSPQVVEFLKKLAGSGSEAEPEP